MFTKVFRIGNDAEIRFTPKGDAVLNLSLAYNYGRKGDDGKRPTQWVEGSLWGKQAEALQPYLLKGSQIGATLDDLHIEIYEGKNGAGHKLVGRIINVELVSNKFDSKPVEPPQENPIAEALKREAREDKQSTAKSAAKAKGDFDDFDDDIPW